MVCNFLDTKMVGVYVTVQRFVLLYSAMVGVYVTYGLYRLDLATFHVYLIDVAMVGVCLKKQQFISWTWHELVSM